MTHSLL